MNELDQLVLTTLFSQLGRIQKRASQVPDTPEALSREWLGRVQAPLTDFLHHWTDAIDAMRHLATGGLPLHDESNDSTLMPLVSPFAHLRLDGRGCEQVDWFLAPTRDTSDPQRGGHRHLYPTREWLGSTAHYAALWQQLEAALRQASAHLTPDLALHLLEQHTALIPYHPSAPTAPWADLPFFDVTKVMAALMACCYGTLWLQRRMVPEPMHITAMAKRPGFAPCLLLWGDLSGVQDFVYRTFSQGALKALRGRSLFLQFLTEHIITELLRVPTTLPNVPEITLSHVHVLYAGGGRFALVLPYAEAVNRHWQQVQNRINAYLRRVHGAKLHLILASEPVPVRMLAPSERDGHHTPAADTFAKLHHALGAKIAAGKAQKFVDSSLLGQDRDGTCQYCKRVCSSQYLVTSEEQQQVNAPGAEDGPLCVFCFLLLPKRVARTELKQKATFGFTPECAWCHQSGEALACTWGEEWLFGCSHASCLGDPMSLGECTICHRHAILTPLPPPRTQPDELPPPEIRACPFCRNLHHVGEHLGGLRYILRSRIPPDQPQRVILQIENVWYYFPLAPPDRANGGAFAFTPADFRADHQRLFKDPETDCWVINDGPLAAWQRPGTTFRFPLGTYTYLSQKHDSLAPASLEELAEGLGARRIGALRMDVDNLGALFQEGLRPDGPRLVRYASLARLLTGFFQYHINNLCVGQGLPSDVTRLLPAAPAQRRVHIIYSGGDDLFLVGHWHDVAELSFDLYQAFAAYTCYNPAVTLSGGFVVQRPTFPLYHLAKRAEDAEKAAKDHDRSTKNALAPFHQSSIFGADTAALKWEATGQVTAFDLLALVQMLLQELCVPGRSQLELKVPRAFLTHLFEVVETQASTDKLYLPKLLYALSRVKVPLHVQHRLLASETIRYLHPALVWLALLTRQPGVEEPYATI
jgi:hypothetical protein